MSYLGALIHLKIKYAMNNITEDTSATATLIRIPVDVLMKKYSGQISA